MTLQERLRRLGDHPRARLIILALAAVLALPTLAIGFFADDYAFIASLQGKLAFSAPWWDLYNFTPASAEGVRAAIEGGQLRWWTSAELRLHLVRPLPSALFSAEWRLLGDAPLGYHLHSIAWYLGLVAAVSALYRRLFSASTSTLALYIFAVGGALAMPVGWVASRHLLIAAVAVVLALLAHLRAVEDGWRPGRLLAPLGLVVALTAGEAGLAGVAYVVAYGLFGPANKADKRALASAGSALAIGLFYLVVYRLVGGGAQASDGYLEPLSDPLGFLGAATVRLPMLLANAIIALPAEFASGFGPAPFVAAGVAATLGLALLVRAVAPAMDSSERAALKWLGAGALLALGASLGGFPGSRQLTLPSLFFAPLFAVLIERGYAAGASRLRRTALGALVFIHVLIAPLSFFANTASIIAMGHTNEAIAASGAFDKPRVFIAASSDPMISTYIPAMRLIETSGPPPCGSLLSGTKGTHRLTRTGERTLRLEVVGGSMLTQAFETLYRASSIPLAVGDEAKQCGATIRVAEVEDGRPTRIDIELDVSFDDPDVALVEWRDGALRPIEVPVGQSVELQWSPGPMGFL